MPLLNPRVPFLVTTGPDGLVDDYAVHLTFGCRRWTLTSTQARELASTLLRSAQYLDRLPRPPQGA
jgi:hypothetical protein